MKRTKYLLFLALLGAGYASHYRIEKTIPVGGEGRWDYVIASDDRLFVPRTTHTMVLSTKTGKILADIPNTAGVHGVALVPSLHRAYTSNSQDGTCTVIDTKTLKVMKNVPSVFGADCIIYDSFSRKVLTFSGKMQCMVAMDPETYQCEAPIVVGGKAEYAASDGAGHVWVNLEDKAEVIKIDMRRKAVENRYSVTGGKEPTGLSFDARNHRLFIGCNNGKLMVMNSDNGKIVAEMPVGKNVDATVFDGGNVMASCGEGKLFVYHQETPDTYIPAQTLTTEPGARTMCVDAKDHKVYLPTADLKDPEADRPTAKPGTFRVLVVGQSR